MVSQELPGVGCSGGKSASRGAEGRATRGCPGLLLLLDLIPQLDLSAFHAYYADELRGEPPFEVVMMVTLLVNGYAVGIRFSRKIAAVCERNLAFRAIVNDDRPDFRTISDAGSSIDDD